MSYSVSNVMAEAGVSNIMRWLPFKIEEQDMRNRLKNKMIRPTTIPQTVEDLMVEHAVSREALRLALAQHKALAVGLKGVQQERSISDAFEQTASGQSLINMMNLNYVIGSGGILAHSPRRIQSALMMIDAYQLQGVTMMAVDSIFMMPHLGVLSQISEKASLDVFYNDCLVKLGTCIAPKGLAKEGEKILDWELNYQDGRKESGELRFGEIYLVENKEEKLNITLKPAKGFDVGAGNGAKYETKIQGGVAGIIFDGRGRPLELPKTEAKRVECLDRWYKKLNMYP
jgi:hypothetical protein